MNLLLREYKSIKQEISQKQKEKKALLAEKDTFSIWNAIRHLQINQRVAELTEDIEELKFRKSGVMLDISCNTDAEVKEVEKSCQTANSNLKLLQTRKDILDSEMDTDAQKYVTIKATIPQEQKKPLLDERIRQRSTIQEKIRIALDNLFHKEHDWKQLSKAEDIVDKKLHEDPYEFKERAFELRWEEEQNRRQMEPLKHPLHDKEQSR